MSISFKLIPFLAIIDGLCLSAKSEFDNFTLLGRDKILTRESSFLRNQRSQRSRLLCGVLFILHLLLAMAKLTDPHLEVGSLLLGEVS